MSDYELVQKSSLKLKGVADGGVKKKKKKSKKSKHDEKSLEEVGAAAVGGERGGETAPEEKYSYYAGKTKAEIAFLKRKEKLDAQRLRDKARETHKDRVEKFNSYLDSLSEHFEQAKVSWTK